MHHPPVILVMDADDGLSGALVSASREHNWRLVRADDVETALAMVRDGGVDVTIVSHPQQDAQRLDLIQTLVHTDRNLDVLLLAPSLSLPLEIEVLRAGPHCRAFEVVDGAEVVRLVEKTLARRAVFEEHREVLDEIAQSDERLRRWLGQLSLICQASERMQSAVELDRLLHLVLTCVTAGEVFGFNRAILMLVDENRGVLEGRFGVGPASGEEAERIWNEMAGQKRSLADLLRHYDADADYRGGLDALARTIRLDLQCGAGVPVDTVFAGKAEIVSNARESARAHTEFVRLFDTDAFASVPLVAAEEVVGVIVADNKFSRHPIVPEHLQVLSLFAVQAGVALERSRVYEELLANERLVAIGTITAGVAHEIRNPLAAIGGFARAIDRDLDAKDPNKRRVGIIVDEVSRLEGLLDELLDFARPRRRRVHPADLNEIVGSNLQLLEAEIVADGITLVKNLAPALPRVEVDETTFHAVPMNLLRNAIHSMRAGGTLTVVTRAVGGSVLLEIADTGTGMNAEDLKRVFEPFFSTKTKGTGLGLMIARRIVHEHDGRIKITSIPGEGTRVRVLLPAVSASGRG